MRTLTALMFTTILPLSLLAKGQASSSSFDSFDSAVLPLSESTSIALLYSDPAQDGECLIPLDTKSSQRIQTHLIQQRPDLYLDTAETTEKDNDDNSGDTPKGRTMLADITLCTEDIVEEVNANPYAFLGGTETAGAVSAGVLAVYYLACTGAHYNTEFLDSLTPAERFQHSWNSTTQYQVSYLGKWASATVCVLPTAINYGLRMVFFGGPAKVLDQFPVAPFPVQ